MIDNHKQTIIAKIRAERKVEKLEKIVDIQKKMIEENQTRYEKVIQTLEQQIQQIKEKGKSHSQEMMQIIEDQNDTIAELEEERDFLEEEKLHMEQRIANNAQRDLIVLEEASKGIK
jgi:hypothetical protein